MSFFKKIWCGILSRKVETPETIESVPGTSTSLESTEISTSLNSGNGEHIDSELYDVTVSDIPPRTKIRVLMGELEKFGEIEDFKYLTTVAFVKYKNSSAVAEMLSNSSMSVRRCNHWDQYLYKDQIGRPEIMKLDPTCLLKIFDRLSLNDQINFAKSDEYFMNVLKKKNYSTINIDLEQFKNKKPLINFLSVFALDIKILVSNQLSTRCDLQTKSKNMLLPTQFLKLIRKSCINLHTVKFYGKILFADDMHEILKMSKLKDLALVMCKFQSLGDHFVFFVDPLQDESLDWCLTTGFEFLKCLKRLDISFCEQFSADNLWLFLSRNPQMTYVNITGCKQIEKSFLLQAIQILKNQTERTKTCEIVTSMEKDEQILELIHGEPCVMITFE